MVIYVIVNSETLKIYVGQHKNEDLAHYFDQKWWAAHKKKQVRSHLYAAMRKYPRGCWSIHPLVTDIETKAALDETERLLIYALKCQHPDVGYNICDGGEGFTGPQSEEAKRKISLGLMNRPVSEETRAKISASQPRSAEQLAALNQTGRHRSAETREKIRQLNAEGKCGMLGRKHSLETLAKMRAAAAGRIISPEQRQKLSAAKMGKPWSVARRAAYEKILQG